jgi:hypothetical protein
MRTTQFNFSKRMRIFKTGQSTKGKITLIKKSQLMIHLLVSYNFPVGLAPPLYVSSASTDSGPVRSRFTYNGQVSDRPKFLNMFKTIGPVRRSVGPVRWSADRSVGPCPADVNRETDSPRTVH